MTPKAPTIAVRGMEMIYIPAGKFLMGSREESNEKPPHHVYVAEFYIARYPVTNAQYRDFVSATGQLPPWHWREAGTFPASKDNHPAAEVPAWKASEYCRWLSEETSRDIRLPTEAQWEKAARGTDGRRYPWGDEFDHSRCNTQDSGIEDTTTVGKYSPRGDSPYGVADMAGNVWEWTSSLGWNYPYDPDDGREEPEAEGHRVIRGGSYANIPDLARVSFRWSVNPSRDYLNDGFRIVMLSSRSR
jgi:formylglycine-generating enzyme required for sulfatase activity